jgi:integrase/recombinase XerD
LSWLRFLGHLEAQDKTPLPFAGLVEHFGVCMRDQRSLSEVTIRHRCWHAQRFLNWLDGQNGSLGEVSFQELDAFLSLQAAQGWSRVSVATCAKALRSFFRHAEAHTWCAKGLAAGIDGPRVFKQEGLPMGPTWPDVERLLTSTRGDRPREIRDHAILLLFALYAFRSGEVAALELGDLHWHVNSLLWHAPSSGGRSNILWCLRSARQSCAIFSRFGPAAPVESSF